jgi:hypothetical protein
LTIYVLYGSTVLLELEYVPSLKDQLLGHYTVAATLQAMGQKDDHENSSRVDKVLGAVLGYEWDCGQCARPLKPCFRQCVRCEGSAPKPDDDGAGFVVVRVGVRVGQFTCWIPV